MLPKPSANLFQPSVDRHLIPAIALILTFIFALPAAAVWEHGDWAVVFDDPNHILDVGAWPDGQGGFFSAGVHQVGLGYHRIMFNRLDHTGTEVWGDGGIWLPINLSANWDSRPLDVVADGSGGAYIAYRQGYGTYEMYVVAHIDAAGGFDWASNVDQVGDYSSSTNYPDLQVAPGAYGGVYVIYLKFETTGYERLKSVHFDDLGGILNFTDVFSNNTSEDVTFEVRTDLSGGALVAWTRNVLGTWETGAQRINTSSNREWGNDGVLVGTAWGAVDDLLAAGSAGAFIVTSQGGQAIGQHLDGTGAKLWGASGKMLHDTHTPWFALSTQPDICTDGAGGFFLIHGLENVFVQRVNAAGGLPWGAAGIEVATGTDYTHQVGRIDYDGFGGAVLRYNTSYEIGSSGVNCKQIQGARVEGSGLILWDEYLWACEYSGGQVSPSVDLWPHETNVVADGSGGAFYVWSERSPTSATTWVDRRVLAKGVGPDGNPPNPMLKEMHSGSGQPGELATVGIFGDYIMDTQDFKLQLAGQPDLPITSLAQHSNQYIQGSLDLTGAAGGIYDLVLSVDGSPVSTLYGAYGVGYPVLCAPDEPFGPNPATPLTAGSKRKTAFGADGTIHMAWIETVAGLNKIFYWNDTMGLEAGDEIFQSYDNIREVSLDVGPDDRLHLVLVVDDLSGDYLHHIFTDELGNRDQRMTLIPGGVHNPSVASLGPNAEIVFEGDIGSETWLFHIQGTPTGFGTVRDLMSGANSREADLTPGDGELVLTFVRDADAPGLRETCYQTYDGASWSMPVALDLALSVFSPSVVWDDDLSILFAWIADDTGSDPRLRTCLMTGGVPGPVRRRATEGDVYSVSVDSPGSGVFYMLTQESETVLPMKVYMCRGDGEAFYPKVLLNSSSDVDRPFFAVEFGTQRVAAWWEEFDEAVHPYHFITCNFQGTGVPELSPVVEARVDIHPNPFNPTTMVTFVLPESGQTSFEIFDVRGRLVRTLVEGSYGVGPHRVPWDGRDNQGESLASGVYFGKLSLPGGGEKVRKMALIR